jgi:site-specific recombinase XerD
MQKRLLESDNSTSGTPTGSERDTPQLALVPGGRSSYTGVQLQAARIPITELENYAADHVNEAVCTRQSKSTIARKKDSLARLVWFLKKNNLTHFGPREFQRFVHYIGVGHEEPEGRWGNSKLREPASDRTIQSYFIYVQAFCRWMMNDIYVPVEVDLSHGVKSVRPAPANIQPFSEFHIEQLRVVARRTSQPLRDEAILLFMLDTGVRADELCQLQWGQVQIHNGYGQAEVFGKGRKKRTVPFSKLAARMLWKYVQETPRSQMCPVFQTVRGKEGKGAAFTRYGLLQLYERLGESAQLTSIRCSPHTMRHTFAINFLRNGGNVFSLQAILGHTDLKMTQNYCKIAQTDIQNQHAQFSPADSMGRKK